MSGSTAPAEASLESKKSASRNIDSGNLSKSPRFFDIVANLLSERVQVFKFLFRAKKFQEANFDVMPVDVAIEVEQVYFEHAFGFSAAHGRANAQVDHAAM